MASCAQEPQSWASVVYAEWSSGHPWPVISDYDPGLPLEEAYRIQENFVTAALAGDAIAGYKAALTTPFAQMRFGVRSPVTGVLFASGRRGRAQPIWRADFGVLMLETELGFVVGRDIPRAPRSQAELRQYLSAVAPVIELPDLDYDEPERVRGVDIIASNTAAAGFLMGAPVSLTQFDDHELDGIFVMLYRGDEVLNRAKAAYTVSGQWSALQWLIEDVLERGWEIHKGQVLLTGALGKMVPGLPGRYRAEYRGLGSLTFEISEGPRQSADQRDSKRLHRAPPQTGQPADPGT